MSDNKVPHSRNRYREAVQWIQAITTTLILVMVYVSRGHFESSFSASKTPENPPIGAVQQESYWSDDFQYGFSASKWDHPASYSSHWADYVAVDSKTGVVFQDAKVKVSYYPGWSLEEIEKNHQDMSPKAYSFLENGIAVVEGDLSSASAKMVLATLH